MDKKQILEEYRKVYHNYSDDYKRIDSNIKPLVEWLRKQGFITFASCGSHIYDHEGNPAPDWTVQAYVAFYYDDADKEKVEALKNHKFPQSEDYTVSVSDMPWSPVFGKNRAAIDIFFGTKTNRIKSLKKIYDSLGISYSKNMRLDRYRYVQKPQNMV